ncbi:hypothetical protein [Blastococcus brunescens]|uniref:Uncharacterized protein n=1 Tax=Blastococcus brunescens TaxID=1564165 RepID=A0ABZ1AUE8_9ACTN|nr:hypothetical protein [Blastococcus sp. BMG 8361]WRL62201.1 hypothetical protein U6N30_19415 [Blastococcus sp. BMG 8361]
MSLGRSSDSDPIVRYLVSLAQAAPQPDASVSDREGNIASSGESLQRRITVRAPTVLYDIAGNFVQSGIKRLNALGVLINEGVNQCFDNSLESFRAVEAMQLHEAWTDVSLLNGRQLVRDLEPVQLFAEPHAS